ncbi:hypothetical protein GCM10011575_44920 [Microlunatus endophyticus]|uniref:N-acetyltransferase domain-containing protein n=1 Tax=Microlunatus endophyticus TaxID=1716077 RepID=A0A917W7Z9_9ACTN|nr:GNAT family N-acetyltransferase [Microlunatus endophyticus]GGL81663.1 hypothetical protein GCM10011575_44920 [Microlunatus endophyticus]
MQQRGRDRVEAFWRAVFGTTDCSNHAVITPHRAPDLHGYPGIYAVLRQETAYVSAPEYLVDAISQWRIDPTTVIDPGWWLRQLPDWQILGPSVHAFTDEAPPADHRASRFRIEPVLPGQLTELRSRVDPAEWGESGFGGDDIEGAWQAVDDSGHVVAAANLTPFDGSPSDVGILTRPEARGRGAATAVGVRATTHAVREFGIARWRALSGNTASRHIADRLGFEPDCLQLALRPAGAR